MARLPRADEPGSWHHVMNRALARRSFFETKDDIRYFLSCLARAVRRGQLEVHAWCVLTTHFHLLVRSPLGELSAAMRRIQNQYVRWFNRWRRRDGSLVRGRFRSKLVDSLAYRGILVRYIDANPVAAGLCSDPRSYPWCSARQYAQPSGPPWLTRTWVESWVVEHSRSDRYTPVLYEAVLDRTECQGITELVERRIRFPRGGGRDELDSLLAMAAPQVLAWLQRKASLADQTQVGMAKVGPLWVAREIQARRAAAGAWEVCPNRDRRDGWTLVHVGLLRDLSGTSLVEIGRRLEVSPVQAGRLYELHRRLISEDSNYGQVSAAAGLSILSRASPGTHQPR